MASMENQEEGENDWFFDIIINFLRSVGKLPITFHPNSLSKIILIILIHLYFNCKNN